MVLFDKKLDPETEARALYQWAQAHQNWVVEEFCLDRGYGVGTLKRMALNHTCMAEALDFANTRRIATLVRGGCDGTYKESMAKFVLQTLHDFQERDQAPHFKIVVNDVPRAAE